VAGAPAIVLAAAIVLLGCGDGELRFSAERFVSELNGRGASLELGAPLVSSREETEIHAVSVGSGAGDVDHGGGSLTVTATAETGAAEFTRCEAAASLLCFRTNNVVLALEDELDASTRAALERALASIAREPPE
jgi:hypothetical protein